MWYQIKSYLKFLLKSNNQHGIHSPFVYDLVTLCFYNKKKYSEYEALKNYRKAVFSNHSEIETTDFGEGSRVFKSNTRKISAIAKNAGITLKRQQLLYRLVQYFQPKNILELGTSVGLGTSALAVNNSFSKINTVEGCINTSEIALKYFDEFNLKNIQLHNLTFEDYFSKNPSKKYDLVYIDGNHNKENTLKYFEILLKQIDNNSMFIFDDIYWSKEMTEAWQKITKHPKVRVSIDTFYWGFIFFRKEQEKEHFCIRL